MEGGDKLPDFSFSSLFFFPLSLWHTLHRVPLHLNYFQMQVFFPSFFYFVWQCFKGILEKKNEARISVSCASAISNFVFKKSITSFLPPLQLICVFFPLGAALSVRNHEQPLFPTADIFHSCVIVVWGCGSGQTRWRWCWKWELLETNKVMQGLTREESEKPPPFEGKSTKHRGRKYVSTRGRCSQTNNLTKRNEMDMINEMTQKAKFATRGENKSRRSQKKKPASFIKRCKWKCTVAASRVECFIWQRSYQPINILWSGCLRSRKPSAYLPSWCVSVAPEKISFMWKPWGLICQASLFFLWE